MKLKNLPHLAAFPWIFRVRQLSINSIQSSCIKSSKCILVQLGLRLQVSLAGFSQTSSYISKTKDMKLAWKKSPFSSFVWVTRSSWCTLIAAVIPLSLSKSFAIYLTTEKGLYIIDTLSALCLCLQKCIRLVEYFWTSSNRYKNYFPLFFWACCPMVRYYLEKATKLMKFWLVSVQHQHFMSLWGHLQF